jgi:hypothetical protein
MVLDGFGIGWCFGFFSLAIVVKYSFIRESILHKRKIYSYFIPHYYIMEIFQNDGDASKKTFLSHVFSTTEEGKAEILNTTQYALLGVVPIVVLNKLIQRFIPEADHDKSSLELVVEVFIQLIIMFCGVILIHRVITYFPTYSGFKYENLMLTNVILAFLIIVLSIQTKLGLKVNILFDRVNELWNGPSDGADRKAGIRNKVRVSGHTPSQADYLDNAGVQMDMFPPAPVPTAVKQPATSYDLSMRGNPVSQQAPMGPMAANSLLGGAFGTLF